MTTNHIRYNMLSMTGASVSEKYTGDKWTMLRWHCTVQNYASFHGSSSLINEEADGEARRSNGAFLLDPPTLPLPDVATIGLYT